MGSRKLSEIQAENEGREARNMEADTYNKRLELRLRRQQAVEIRTWKQESDSRGYVEVHHSRGGVTPLLVEPTESPPDTTQVED